MEWVETTGRSVSEAKEAALDELGVDESDAEFEVVAEAQTGLFGRLRSEARVRARVKPTAPRAKEDRRGRDRKRRSGASAGTDATTGSKAGGSSNGGRGRSAAAGQSTSGPAAAANREGGDQEAVDQEAVDQGGGGSRSADVSAGVSAGGESGGDTEGRSSGGSGGGRRNRRRAGSRPGSSSPGRERRPAGSGRGDGDDDDNQDDYQRGKGPEVEVDLDRQAEVGADFLRNLTGEFGLSANITVARPDEDTVELQLSGTDLGILIGPKGATLQAVQNLTRTVVFNETGGNNGHINVDVGGYRQKRSEALSRFAEQVADQVKSSGNRTALEPMSAVDRKVVHDTISGIDGVSTISEGEDPRRRVVILPA